MATKKTCFFCKKNLNDIDYRDVALLEKYLSNWAKIKPGRESGTCAKHQRKLARALKAARYMALLPYVRR